MKPVLLQPCYVLHRRPYRETSFLIDIFSKEHGRISVIAKGVRKANSAAQGLLQPFAPLFLSWSGRGELMTLSHIEANGACHSLQGKCLYAGFYLNELLMHLLQKWDPHPRLFDKYNESLLALTHKQLEERILRTFEKWLLDEIGYGLLPKEHVSLHNTFLSEKYYRFTLEQGFVLNDWVDQDTAPTLFLGKNLLAIAKEEWEDGTIIQDAKRLFRLVLTSLLGQKPIHSRKLFIHIDERSENE